ncbi:MAG: UbiD family decarboxylase [Deltaproteobacteria bacterium]|nr:UbiD family decarboxylase [Deltaproteobacteria bacterium]
MQEDLRSFLEDLKSAGYLLVSNREADPCFEIPGVMKQAEKIGNAIHFKKVKASEYTLVNNILGSRDMLALLFGTRPEGIVNEWISRTQNPIRPVIIDSGPVKEVTRKGGEVDLGELPIVTHCGKDAGPYVTAGIVIAKDPETGIRNVSINRMQLKGRNKLGIRMMPPQHLGLIFEKCEKMKKDLEVAVAIGNHPFELLAAATTLEFGFDEFELSGALRMEPLQLVKCETVDLEVPGLAEIVLEGTVSAGIREGEGPFGDFMQYYVPVMENPVLEVHAMTHRKAPIYQTIQAGSLEDVHLLGLSREAKIYGAVSKVADVKALSLAPTILGCAISIKKRHEGEAKNVAAAAFGIYSWLKYCIVVDHDVDVFDIKDVWWAVNTRSRPDTGLLLIENALGFPRDPFNIHQSKLGIDATAPLNQWDEFERKVVPDSDHIRLEDYL